MRCKPVPNASIFNNPKGLNIIRKQMRTMRRCAFGLFFASPRGSHFRTKFRARKTTFAGRSASLRIKYGYQAFPYGTYRRNR